MKHKVFIGISLKLFERVGAQVIGLVVSIVLARLLEPEAVGVVSLANMFILFFNVISVYGLGNALIQNKDADEIDFSTAFFGNIVLSLALYIIIFCLAPLIERFYEYEKYNFIEVIRILSITVIFNGIKSVIDARISKEFKFKYFFYSSLISLSVSGAIGIYLAYTNRGLWALVIYNVISVGTNTLLLCCFEKWKPHIAFSFEKLKKIWSFGWKLILVGLLNSAYLQIRSLIIAKKYTSEDLAYYNRGFNLAKIVPEELGVALMAVLFPAFAEDWSNIKSDMQKAVSGSSFVVFPGLIWLFIVADDLIEVLFTAKWIAAVPFLRLFCISYLLYSFEVIVDQVIKATGKGKQLLIINIIKKIVGIIAILFTMNLGPIFIAIGYTVSAIIGTFISAFIAMTDYKYSIKEQLSDILPAFASSLIMAAACILIVNCMSASPLVNLIVEAVVAVPVYFLCASVLNKKELSFYKNIIRSVSKKGGCKQ